MIHSYSSFLNIFILSDYHIIKQIELINNARETTIIINQGIPGILNMEIPKSLDYKP